MPRALQGTPVMFDCGCHTYIANVRAGNEPALGCVLFVHVFMLFVPLAIYTKTCDPGHRAHWEEAL